jgi:hypothetical protein
LIIVNAYPPLFDEIDARFHIGDRAVLFAWGDWLFNPKDVRVPAALVEHEKVHGRRQGDDITGWWRRYIDDDKFRLEEEIIAHRAEYQQMCKDSRRRFDRRKALRIVAGKLAAPLYGSLITVEHAKSALRQKPNPLATLYGLE